MSLPTPALNISPSSSRKSWWCAAVAAATLLGGPVAPCRARPAVKVTGRTAGVTPFISLVSLSVRDPAALDHVTFRVLPKTGSVTRALSARYSTAYLQRRGYVDAQTGIVTVPVFGLYAGYANTVTLTAKFTDGSSQKERLTITTRQFKGDLHKHPGIAQARTRDTSLSYDFILLKNFATPNTPIILDTDGELRWVGTAGVASIASILYGNGIYLANGSSLLRTEFDGSTALVADYGALGVLGFHHNMDHGRDGILAELDLTTYYESDIVEIDPGTGQLIRGWNLAEIISAAMTAGGDDPGQFVKPAPDDWFHNNSATYRASDNTLIVSSRENFVIALDYDTQAIKWILGDPAKSWYQFPSLRKYALNLGRNTHVPIGQHAVSVVGDELLLFDNGYGSLNQTLPGVSRSYSAARKYRLDLAANTASEVWRYTARRMISSPVCSSVYEDAPDNFLLDYATAGPFMFAELIGLNPAGGKVFDYKFPEVITCGSGWNAAPVHLEALTFD